MNEISKSQDVTSNEELNSEENTLLAQIDAFRDKAKELSDLITAKETRINDLEAINAKQAEDLENALQDSDTISINIDEDINKILSKLDEVEAHITNKVENDNSLSNPVTDMDEVKSDISEKIHSENVKLYRNVNNLMEEEFNRFDDYQKIVKAAKNRSTLSAVFSILSFVTAFALLAFKLLEMGLLSFLF